MSLDAGPPQIRSARPAASLSGSSGVEKASSKARTARGPERLQTFQLLAQRAWIRQRLPKLSTEPGAQAMFEAELRSGETRLSQLMNGVDSEIETRFHRAALDKAIEVHGECSRAAQEHAARLSELRPGQKPEVVISQAAGQLSQSSQSMGLMRYAEGFLYVFRRTVGGLQITASPVDETRAFELLQQLNVDETILGNMDTATRVDACRPEVLPTGERLRIEVDHEGFWVSVEQRSGLRLTLKTPIPHFEEAEHYVRGSLREDLMAGLGLTEAWSRSDGPNSLADFGPLVLKPVVKKSSGSPGKGSGEKSSLGRTLWSMLSPTSESKSPIEPKLPIEKGAADRPKRKSRKGGRPWPA